MLTMSKKSLSHHLAGPQKDPVRNDLSLYCKIRFKDKLASKSLAMYYELLEAAERYEISKALELVNVVELQLAMGVKITGKVNEDIVQVVKRLSEKKRDSSATKTLCGSQYQFRELIIKYEQEEYKKKHPGGRMKICRRTV